MTYYGIPEQVEELKRKSPVSDWLIIVSDTPMQNLTVPLETDPENFHVAKTRVPHLFEIYRKQYGVMETILIDGKSDAVESDWKLKQST